VVLREVEQCLRPADRMAACLVDPRAPDQITHTLAAIMRFRLLMIAAGCEDGNDADTLRGDPMFKMALDLLPSDRELCSQPTISRFENLPDARALLRLGRAMVDLYCESFHQVPGRITLDIDDTFDAVHGGQQLVCSTRITMNTAFSRSSCSTARAVSSPPCCVPPNGQAACAGYCGPSARTGRGPKSCCSPTVIIAAPRFSTFVASTGSIIDYRPVNLRKPALSCLSDGALNSPCDERYRSPTR
jgi:hypothetical protein